jgi:hypothetical protein
LGSLVPGPKLKGYENDGLDHYGGADDGWDGALGGSGGAAEDVEGAVPDRNDENARARAVVEPGEHNRPARQAECEPDVLIGPKPWYVERAAKYGACQKAHIGTIISDAINGL